jgi:hypothetical protein
MEHEFLKQNTTPESLEARRRDLLASIEDNKAKRDAALKMSHVFHGALEEHSWVETNFFKYAG